MAARGKAPRERPDPLVSWAAMSRWILVAAGATLLSCEPATECDDRCGEGTVCVAGKCEVAPEAAEAEPEPAPAGDDKRKRRRRRGRKRGGDDEAAGPVPTFNDASVPKFNPNRGSSIGEGAGSERISDRTIRQHLSRFEPRLNQCIEQLAAAGVEIGSAKVSFDIGIDPNGKVWGVTAHASKAMRDTGLIACMRLKISKFVFPSWDGPPVSFEYSFEVS